MGGGKHGRKGRVEGGGKGGSGRRERRRSGKVGGALRP